MNYILGLDLGSASLGWAVLECDDASRPFRIVRTGVRLFEAGVEGSAKEATTKLKQGRESSKAATRREARQPRRQYWRTQRRKRNLFSLLQRHSLLPPSESNQSASRKAVFDKLDAELTARHVKPGDHTAHQQLPYLLRTKALSERLEPTELGRAIYNLAQRRGFASNRKTDSDEKTGVVHTEIKRLREELNGRTLAETIVDDLDPHSDDPKIRRIRGGGRYTGRTMFEDEFDLIRAAQESHFQLTEDDWKAIRKSIFFQRPLKSQKHLVGKCEIDGKRRCLKALDAFQQFRIWQDAQNLQLVFKGPATRPTGLTLEEQTDLVTRLQSVERLSWASVRNQFGITKAKFKQEESQKNGLQGHATNAKLSPIFGDKWWELSVENRDAIVRDVVHYNDPKKLVERACREWGLPESDAERLDTVGLPQSHGNHSESSMRMLIERMQTGEAYSKILHEAEERLDKEPMDLLPPLLSTGVEITNTAVIRALTEMRKVVNELIRDYKEKPVRIHIEMARDMKRGRKERDKIFKANEQRRRSRERAKKRLLEAMPDVKDTRANIEKWLLWEECKGICPYTGIVISKEDLFGPNPRFHVEHIFPRKYLDDSFQNKTLCEQQENIRKGNETPFDAYRGQANWEEILRRVENFDGSYDRRATREKIRRFRMSAEDIDSGFVARHLNDTRYNAKAAKRYLELLYGGTVDKDGKQRIVAVAGGITSDLRWHWGRLDQILAPSKDEARETDHRHHAVDAVVIAMTDQQSIGVLQRAASNAFTRRSQRFFETVDEPWDNFRSDVEAAMMDAIVSKRITRRLSGALHAGSIYSKPHRGRNGQKNRLRRELKDLSDPEIRNGRIVDPKIRHAVEAKIVELGYSINTKDVARKVFKDPQNHPMIRARGSQHGTPIHRVRVQVTNKPVFVGDRFVETDGNAAMLICAKTDASGNDVAWKDRVFTRLEVAKKLATIKSDTAVSLFEPLDSFPHPRLLLFRNDYLYIDWPDGPRKLCRVQNISDGDLQLCEHNQVNAPKKKPWRVSPEALRKRNARRVEVSPTGHARELPLESKRISA